jgi:Ca2+-binding RTX toxin-like protein
MPPNYTTVTVQGVAFTLQTSDTVATALASAIATAINSAGTAATTTILSSGEATTVPAGTTGIVISPAVANPTVVAGGGAETLIAGDGGLTFTAPTASTVTILIDGQTPAAGGGTNAITIGGGSTYNVVVTTGTNVLQVGGSGTVQAGSGSNTIVAAVGTAATAYVLSEGTADVIRLGAGAATVNEYGSGAVIDGGAGADVINDAGSSDTVYAGSGAETVAGGQQDLIFTQTSTLIFFSDGGLTTVEGGTGTDTIVGAPNSGITYNGTAGVALLLAGAGVETLNASSATVGVELQGGLTSGSDLLKGGYGNDTLFGGSASSTMIGGAGSNVYEFVAGSTSSSGGIGSTTILGFKQTGTVQDVVALFGYGGNEVSSALASATVSGDDTTITLADGSTVTFAGTTSLNLNNFGAESIPNPCFASGTKIATPSGEVPVEALAIGDQVLTAGGPPRKVRWIGHRRANCRPGDQPIIIRAHAFGRQFPRRDLILSPDHSIFVENALVPIRHLVNRTSISPYPTRSMVYWHVELDDHDIILAEGLPAESYLDTGNRTAFTAIPAAPRHPDYNWAVWETLARAPLVVTGPTIDRLRAYLSSPSPLAGALRCGGRSAA